MTEPEFLAECDRILQVIEDALDRADIDVDSERSGNVLTLEFEDTSKIIVNGNTPLRELWIAAKSGGFHFSHRSEGWIDSRGGDEFFAALSKLVSQQAQAGVILCDR
jgi:CyaY protein